MGALARGRPRARRRAARRRDAPARRCAAAAAAAAPLGLGALPDASRAARCGAAAPAWWCSSRSRRRCAAARRAIAVAGAAARAGARRRSRCPSVERSRRGRPAGRGDARRARGRAAAAAARRGRRPRAPAGRGSRLRRARARGGAGLALVAVVAGRQRERPPAPRALRRGRLASAPSNRYEYWRVALGAFADHPLLGIGAGGFAVEWLRERPIAETVRDAHSLYIETRPSSAWSGSRCWPCSSAGAGGVRGPRARPRPAPSPRWSPRRSTPGSTGTGRCRR